jgi:hypothetical protein
MLNVVEGDQAPPTEHPSSTPRIARVEYQHYGYYHDSGDLYNGGDITRPLDI